ncbi:MAG: LOG family protein [Gemmataceae bacterium]
MTNVPFDPAQLAGSPGEAMEILRKSVFELWDVVNNLTRLRPRCVEHYYVTIFGSARIQPETAQYHDIRRLAAELARLGCQIVTGGGPGLMQAANEGAIEGDPGDRDGSIGIRVDLPFEQNANAFVGKVYEHKTFFTRLHHFMQISNAFIVVPGGIGTTLELLMVWQLLQVKHMYDTPLILVGSMWEELVEWASKHMIQSQPPLANAKDMTIPRCVTSVDEALELVREHYRTWQESCHS